ncbi:hypothetical protein [Foetidibacter luteolus]|uniref:hypothetical protein n=1 Tax=Foetidibacter luteolus TaxID=2608880 RepID=UPI00129AEF66|nr:hypothetical protein [Foetidibacter luteolus]
MSTSNNHVIGLEQAMTLTRRFQKNRAASLPVSETFDARQVNTLLSAEQCAALRVYLGEQESGDICMVLIAVNSAGEDILPVVEPEGEASTDQPPVILEDGLRCPPNCPTFSPLVDS